ncbi:hypothetical protein sos41_04800 [Alphaproteobacteria bacterium SO-S41]|nr:hypothetical protein sos41_04800 [Alphaproteobacteria bacterium SO-S41]
MRARLGMPGWAVIALVAVIFAVVKWLGLPAQVADAVKGAPERFDVMGTARITDGDTLRIGDRRIRLNAIDAPESKQLCGAAPGARKDVACGARSRDELAKLIGTGDVACTAEGEDKYGRLLATCYAGRTNLNRAMVRAGWALAYRRYSDRYVLDEMQAQADGAGLWALDFETPEDWRRTAASQ